MPKLVTVIGASGIQGGSVVKALLSDSDFAIRAVTRNKQSDAMQKLAAQNVEVVQADANDTESLRKAFRGSYAIYAATNFFESFATLGPIKSGDVETAQGINMAKAAAATETLQHYIWSTFPNANHISGGEYTVAHYASKNKVDDFIKADPELAAKTTFLWVAYYASNLNYPFWKPMEVPMSGKYIQLMSSPASVQVPCIGDARHNVGLFAHAVLRQPEKTLPGAIVVAATETLTAGELLQIWCQVHGKEAEYVVMDKDSYIRLWGQWGALMHENFAYWEAAGDKSFRGDDEVLTKENLGIKGLIPTAEALKRMNIEAVNERDY